MPTHTFKTFDIVIAPFPFTDSVHQKNRPLVILSSTTFSAHSNAYICAMITSSTQIRWHGDTPITNLAKTGLIKPSHIRLKIFTIEAILLKQVIGSLSTNDQQALIKNMQGAFGFNLKKTTKKQ
ncbi:type II toxin-antitoxin system PemK/MazF family toxin [Candidatus Dependentiae bacterium]|nr:type II toxin-antitoxin system PemK/MazF family toxin [Candidatus Dependentiae bacterium]